MQGRELLFDMHIVGCCSTWLGRSGFPVFLLHYGFPPLMCQNWFSDKISAHNVSNSSGMVAFNGKCQVLSFDMHIMGSRSTWLGRSGFRVFLLHHGLCTSILQMFITRQPIGAVCSFWCLWTALVVGQPGLGYQSPASQLLGFSSRPLSIFSAGRVTHSRT